MRIAITALPLKWRIELSFPNYKNFESPASLPELKQLFQNAMSGNVRYDIYVMVSQNDESELTSGDGHEYGPMHEPFDKGIINKMVCDCLKAFA